MSSGMRSSAGSAENASLSVMYPELLVRSISNGVILTDPEGVVISTNDAAESLTGCTAKGCAGEHLNAVLNLADEKSGKKIEKPFLHLRDQVGEKACDRFNLTSKEGNDHLVEARCTQVIEDSSEEIYLIELIDLTEQHKIRMALREREKELFCLHRLNEIIEDETTDIERVLERSVEILPVALLHSDFATARITFDDSTYESGRFGDCTDTLEAKIRVDEQQRGKVAIGYLEERPVLDEGPFLSEERSLINNIADRIGRVASRFEVQQNLLRDRTVLGSILDGIEDVVYVADPDTYQLLHVNEFFQDIWGSDVIGEKCYEVLQGRDDPCPFCTNDKIFGEYLDKVYVWEFQNEVTGDWYRCADKAIPWPSGKHVRFEIAMNITEQKKLFQALSDSEARYRTVVENIPQKIFVKDRDCVWQSVNKRFAQDLGLEPEEVRGKVDSDFFPRELAEKHHADDLRIMETGETDSFDEEYIEDGKRKVVHTIKTPVRDGSGKIVGILGVFWDVTEERRVQDALMESEERFRLLAHSAKDMIYRMSIPEGVYEYVSPASKEIFGYDPEDFYNNPILIAQTMHPDWHDYFQEEWAKLLKGDMSQVYEYQIIRKDGKVRWLNQRNSLIRGPDGEPRAIQGIVTDVTDEKAFTEDLARLNRDLKRSNEELEQFAYVASHDLQEPLRMVSSYTQLLAKHMAGDLDEKTQKYINYAVDGAGRMQTLINDLLAFSRITTRGKKPVPVDSHSILGEVIRDLSRSIEESAAIITNDDLPKIRVDASQFAIVLRNLISNAIKFNDSQHPHVHISCSEHDAGMWLFQLKDNGIGIDKEYSDRVFEIFQRLHSRREYSGTGIGLAICRRVIERHGGSIWIESEPGEGTTFFFTVPRPQERGDNE